MSYEGIVEYLCPTGHYWTEPDNFLDFEISTCPVCKGEAAHEHRIDQTNGLDPEDTNPHPSLVPAPKKEIGFDDIWCEDHYGNKYAVKHTKYEPLEHWRAL